MKQHSTLVDKVNRLNYRICWTEKPKEFVDHEKNSPKVNVCCALGKIESWSHSFLKVVLLKAVAIYKCYKVTLFLSLTN